ncbi:MAG: HAD family hydrolase [Gemmatimonadota bacterium]
MSPDRRPAVFFDRDGTLIQEREYLADPGDVALVPGVAAALRALRESGYVLVVVTNQSGIARGLYTEEDYRRVAHRLDELLEDAGASVDATYYCVHHPDFTGPCACRKPGTGMHRQAERDLGLDLAGSWYVGDKITDLLPAKELGGRAILVRTGYGREEEGRVPDGVAVRDALGDAAETILEAGPRGTDSAGGVDPP